MDPEVAPDAGPLSRDFRFDYRKDNGAGTRLTPEMGIISVLLSPVLSKHQLHVLWRVSGGDEYLFKAELVFMRNRSAVIRLPLETYVRTATVTSQVDFYWAAGLGGAEVATNAAQCQYVDPDTGLTATACVPAFCFSAEADQLLVNITQNDTIGASPVSAFFLSGLLFSRKP